MTKIDIRTEAARPIYAGVGATDVAVGFVREHVADVQKLLIDVQKDAKARRAAIEARFADLQFDPKSLPTRVQALVFDNVGTVNGAYADLAKRGETLVERIRKQSSTQETVAAAETTTAKAKTTKTQATKATKKVSTTAKTAAKKTSTTAKPAKSSAKATATSAQKTAASAAEAVVDAADKVGDQGKD
jgi:DNA-binding protein HU-beta